MQRELLLNFHNNNAYAYWTSLQNTVWKWIESESRHMFYKIVLSAIICHFCENLMIAHAALVLKKNIYTTICKHTGNSWLYGLRHQ